MQITVYPEQVNSSGVDMLELSRTVRRCREETEDVRIQLQRLSGLEECRRDLWKQEETLLLTMNRLLDLSGSLMEIAEMYSTGEARNVEALESRSWLLKAKELLTYGQDSELYERIRNILYQ